MEELEGARHNEKEGEATDAGRSDSVTLPDTKGQTLDRGCPSCAVRSDFSPFGFRTTFSLLSTRGLR